MNNKDIIKQLENIDFPEINMPNRQQQLRMALLKKNNKKLLFSDFFEDLSFIIMNKKLTFAKVLVLAVAVVSLSFMGLKGVPQAEAKQIAQNSYNAVASLSTEQLESLKKQVGTMSDPAGLLEEAKNASDLTTLTYDQLIAEDPNIADLGTISISSSNTTGGSITASLKNAKILKFTNKEGNEVLVAISSASNLPIFISISNPSVKILIKPISDTINEGEVELK